MHGVDSSGCLFFIAFLAVGAALSSIGAEWLLGVGGVYVLFLCFRELKQGQDWDSTMSHDELDAYEQDELDEF